uniref:Protein kinase domain-containing protein n=1 Tax=Panagrolaimus sp. ES5 TaxID=591445 RepID=A0AC34FFW5_9BILA
MLRGLGKAVYKISQEAVIRIQNARLLPSQKTVLKALKPATRKVIVQASRAPLSRNVFLRTFQQAVRSSRLFLRPFSAINLQQFSNFNDRERRRNRFRGLYKIQRRKNVGVIERIRDVFNTNVRYNKSLTSDEFPNALNGYDIGNHIACGCSAAVYELKKKNPNAQFNALSRQESDSTTFPLALKIMFNYNFERPERYLWDEMGPELIPLTSNIAKGKMGNIKFLSRNHPNVIKLHTAFTDIMPILPGAEERYPEAIPQHTDYIALDHESRTLFIVMKRYRMTLREYVITQKRNYWTSRVMYGQLLEAIVFLYEHCISHRDMKSDNCLVDFNFDGEVPHLVLSDFGSALSTGSWKVKYSDECVDLGGNLCLRAPEVRRAKPGPNTEVDFEMADTWAAATLGYEMFTRINPFYSRMSSDTYEEEEIPTLPRRLQYAVKNVTYQMLKINPEERPKPHIAANVISISLFRYGQDVKVFLEECGVLMGWNTKELKKSFSKTLKTLGSHLEQKLDYVTELYAAETIISKLICPKVISPAELQLRATFLARLNRDDIWPAMEYFFDEESYREHSNGGSSTHSSGASSASTKGRHTPSMNGLMSPK